MDLVALVLQPAEDDRSIETAGISENAARHERVFPRGIGAARKKCHDPLFSLFAGSEQGACYVNNLICTAWCRM